MNDKAEYYNRMIKIMSDTIKNLFGEDIKLIESHSDFDWGGSFLLRYEYIPMNYIVSIEHERNNFGIIIKDSEGASNPLRRIAPNLQWELNENNIVAAISELKKRLDLNDFSLYMCDEKGRLYEKTPDGKKNRINMDALLNHK